MGNKPAKPAARLKDDVVILKIVPPIDHAWARWLARDVKRIHGFPLRNASAIKPPDHYIECMKMNGLLDVDLDDPDLAHLFK
ncbi:unnamed protein product [Cuscuta epithymum]|uniref:Uncharacterized protein n=1 Tax=Cuscuta epithymum TaxID=186058 RepID=A0AAV0G6R7_9ASTE|nr:unnamed protein product [Cuscuta epithymum]